MKIKMIKLTKKNNYLQKYAIELSIFTLLTFSLIVSVSSEINGWVSVWYVADYSIGFSSRLIIGSFLHTLFGNYITTNVAYTFVIINFLIGFLLLSMVIGQGTRRLSNEKQKLTLLVLVGLYLASPASFGYLWTVENMGRLELYLFVITLLIVLLSFYIDNSIMTLILFTLLGILCIAIHQVYMFLFFPILLVIFIDHLYRSQFQKSILIGTIISIFILCVVCLFFQFGSNILYDDPLVLTALLQTKTDLFVSDGVLTQEYFWEFSDHFTNNMLPELRTRFRNGVYTVLMLSPILVIFIKLWLLTIKNAKSKIEKSKYIMMILTNVTFIPAFALLTDWGRWFGAFFTVQFLIFLYLAAKNDENILYSFEKFSNTIKKYPFVFLVILLYLTCFEKFEGCNYVDEVQTFYLFLYKIRQLLHLG